MCEADLQMKRKEVNRMNTEARRTQVFDKMDPHSILILYSGIEQHISIDDYAHFEADRNFFYLTGLRRERMILLLDKTGKEPKTMLFIEEADPSIERWTGHMVTKEEAKEISGIEDIRYVDSFPAIISSVMRRNAVENAYFDCYRYQAEDMADYNLLKAQEFAAKYPAVRIRDLSDLVAAMRMSKTDEEVELVRKAVDITRQGLERVMSRLTPGMKEYQAQADFEYEIKYQGAEGPSFPTIAGSGKNGTMLHYETNQDTCEDGTLLLLDLGAKYQGYCADITRTYPVNGKFTERQRKVYEIVLKANRDVVKAARPGVTMWELDDIAKKTLAQGCIELGLIQEESEVGKYYMHGVSHDLGIDVHDVTSSSVETLQPGAIITDEPGLYIDEWEIGIRIEDDLLITEDGCEVLSKAIIREADEIEAFMSKR